MFFVGIYSFDHYATHDRLTAQRIEFEQIIQNFLIGYARVFFMSFVVGIFNVPQNKVDLIKDSRQKFLVKIAARFQNHAYFFFFYFINKSDRLFGKKRRLSARNGNSALIAVKKLVFFLPLLPLRRLSFPSRPFLKRNKSNLQRISYNRRIFPCLFCNKSKRTLWGFLLYYIAIISQIH